MFKIFCLLEAAVWLWPDTCMEEEEEEEGETTPHISTSKYY
jgi:hypothetical protein